MILAGPLATVAAVALLLAPQGETPAVRLRYLDAMAQERAVREALADPAATIVVLKAVRTAVEAYESLVRRYPNSSYCDNALWQAGHLSLAAFDRFGQAREKETGIRLLQALTTAYPTSKLVSEARRQLAARQAGPAGAQRLIATIHDIRRAVLADVVRVTIELDREAPFHEERISDPARIFVDFALTRTAPALVNKPLKFDVDRDIVREVRIGRHPNTTTRVVLDATGVSSYSVYQLYNPYRLVIDCVRAAPVTASAGSAAPALHPEPPAVTARPSTERPLASSHRAAGVLFRLPAGAPASAALQAQVEIDPLRSRALATAWGDLLPVVAPSAAPVLAAARTESARPASAPMAIGGSPGAAPNLRSGFSMARQLGLGVSRIVLDPGHGGHDPGAKGRGLTEAELVLDLALRLEKLLKQEGVFEVILTRRTDEFVPLQERTAVANRESADLFLSIHANASNNSRARGVETYFLNFASSGSAAAVAARENAASGQAMAALPDFVKAIALNNKLDESRDFATLVQRSLVDGMRKTDKTVRNLGVKQAPFVVLIGASMPSVLAEVAFLTNAQEAKLVRSGRYRQRIAEALFNAIVDYRISLGQVRTVAHQ
jgi:N-acetylmuramoyl-L-alanine amidase